MHFISVVIPTYNRENYLGDTLKSVFNQKLPKNWGLEVTVVDDGSTDRTKNLVMNSGYNCNYIQIEHTGLPAIARNVGIRSSKGELIAFQDSDDLWPQNKLMKQIKIFENKNIVFCYGNAEKINEKGIKSGELILPKKYGKQGKIFDELIKENFVSTLTVVARKESIEKVGLFNESKKLFAVEDYHLWLRLSLIGDFSYIDEPLAYYRVHDLNISKASQIKSVLRLIKLFKLLIVEVPEKQDLIKKRIKQLHDDAINLSYGIKKMYYKLAKLGI